MTEIDYVIVRVQATLTALFLIGYFTTLGLLLLGYARVPPTFKDTFSALLGVLTAGIPLLLSFWFNRSRAGSGQIAST